MITKYVGAANELNNASKVALVESSELLNKSQIPQMYPDYFGNNYRITLIADKIDGITKFILDSTEEKFSFNVIVFYDMNGSPIGFSMLNDIVDLSKYKIEQLIIVPEFIITSDTSYIDVSIEYTDYKTHIESTSKVHKNLFNANNHAININEASKSTKFRTAYSNKLIDALINKCVYRYSGNLLIGDKLITQVNAELPIALAVRNEIKKSITSDPTTDLSEFNRLMMINNTLYLISYYNQSTLKIINLDNNEVKTLSIDPIKIFGTNYIITKSADQEVTTYKLLSTQSLVQGNIELIINIDFNVFDKELRFTKRLDTGELLPYIGDTLGINKLFNPINDIFDLLGIYDLSSISDIIGVTEGAVVYLTYNNRLHIKTNCLLKTESGSIINGELELPNVYNRIEYISDKAFLLKNTQDSYWYLLQFSRIDTDIEYSAIITKLGGEYNWSRLDLLSKSSLNPFNTKILMTPVNGQLMRYITNQSNLITKIMAL